MTTDATPTNVRTDKLILARREASRLKTTRALAPVARLRAAGEPVTFARVARTANVSTWFTYNNTDVAAAVREARADQAEHGLRETMHPGERVSATNLRVDLEHARHENRDLKAQVRKLQQAIGRRLGAEVEAVDPVLLREQAQILEQRNSALSAELDQALQRVRDLETEQIVTHDELVAARKGLRRMIRQRSIGLGESVGLTPTTSANTPFDLRPPSVRPCPR